MRRIIFAFGVYICCQVYTSCNTKVEERNGCDSDSMEISADVDSEPMEEGVCAFVEEAVSASAEEGKSTSKEHGTCAGTRKKSNKNLIIYTPDYSKVDLVCGTMPSVKDEKVIFCAEAAFTGDILNEFKHSNIAGDHVSGGVFNKGYYCKRNSGAFVYYNGTYKFLHGNYSEELKQAANNGGMGFCQEMMIHKGKKVKTTRGADNSNEFRALCELDGKLVIIDTNGVRCFGDFMDDLLSIGVTEALYLDMGPGWNFSWWRDNEGYFHYIHNHRIECTTNWITFYK